MTNLPGAVCADGHDYWHSDDVRERATAVSLCLACPARAACTLDNVQGTGNTRYGVEGTYGAMVKRVNASAITGALGDTKPGAVAATAWGATPVTDPDQLVRIGT
jgi:hypothetical protein